MCEFGVGGNPLGQEVLLERDQWIAGGLFFSFRGRAIVRLVVGKRVAVWPDHMRMNERRALPLASILRGTS